jgi:hypothetical protein
MSLENLLKIKVLSPEETSKEEIKNLLDIARRCIKDAKIRSLSNDGRFAVAFNAALSLSTIPLRVKGFRASGQGHHMNTLATIPLTLGVKYKNDSQYLERCRRIRDKLEYDCINQASDSDVEELIEFVAEFEILINNWLKENY